MPLAASLLTGHDTHPKFAEALQDTRHGSPLIVALMIDLDYWPTPNGKKVTILLEELGVPYNAVPCKISRATSSPQNI